MSEAAATSPSRPRRLRRIVVNLAVLAVTSAVCLVLLELVVRWQLPFFRPEAQLQFRLTTNGVALGFASQTMRLQTPKGDYNLDVSFNADGFRDVQDFRSAAPGDWFAVGDSYTMGWGVDETNRFSSRLQHILATNGASLRVFNIAIPDNFIGYQRLVRHVESLGTPVRRLIIGVCMENDLRDYRDGKSAWDDQARAQAADLSKEGLRRWLKQHSALYLGLSVGLQSVPFLRHLFERAGIARDIQVLTGANAWDETVLSTSRDELVKLAAGREALVLIIPSRNLWRGEHIATETRIHEEFLRLLAAAGLSVVDMRPVQEQLPDPMSCYFTTDPHWNAAGHALAAQALFQHLAHANPSNRP